MVLAICSPAGARNNMRKEPLNILTIDDDRGCRVTTARFLALTGGHIVEAAENGREGLKKAAALKPDIILLDMDMPDMSGLQVMDALYADTATRNIPVIILTGTSAGDAESLGLNTRPNFSFLERKPANLAELLKKIESILQPGIPRPAKRGAAFGDSPEAA